MTTPQVNFPKICCDRVHHYKRQFEFICMNGQCIKSNNSLLCFYCLQQSHANHSNHTISIRAFIQQSILIVQKNNKSYQSYDLQSMLLSGLSNCNNKQQLSLLLQQIYRTIYIIDNNKTNRINTIVNEEVRQLKTHNQKKYLKVHLQDGQVDGKNIINRTNKLLLSTQNSLQFHQPILSFININSNNDFILLSPFQVKHNRFQSISTCFAYPSLSTYSQSLQIVIKIIKSTPNWIALGLCIGQPTKYQQSSKSHITLLSNGWVNNKGQLTEDKTMIFSSGHQIKIKWDKHKQLIAFRNLTTKNQHIVKHSHQWKDDIFLFTSMYYTNDTISIVQSSLI